MCDLNASLFKKDGTYITTIYHVDRIVYDEERDDYVITSYGFVTYWKPKEGSYLVLKYKQKGDDYGKEKTHDEV